MNDIGLIVRELLGETITVAVAAGRIDQGEMREAWEVIEGKGGNDRAIAPREQNYAGW